MPRIIDTHQHLWDLDRFRLPWIDGEPALLRRSYVNDDYVQAIEGLRDEVRAIYMEVDVEPSHRADEASHVSELCASDGSPTVAGVVGGRLTDADFDDYLAEVSRRSCIKGVRQVLHVPTTPPGFCLQDDFVRSVQRLGELGLSFDVCIRPRELGDAVELARRCRRTTIIIDHCGNADPKAFDIHDGDQPWHDADDWRREMSALAELENTVCKISGIVVRTREGGWSADDLAPIVNHCLDTFGPDRVVFGSDWPVCRLRAELVDWVEALRQIVASRPEADRRKLWSENAERVYRL